MAQASNYPGADRVSRYYYPRVSGVFQTKVSKLVWHSTETSPLWDCPGYNGGLAAPTLTINPWKGRQKVWQHFPANMSAKALVDSSATVVRENRDEVAQIEVIGYSQRSINPTFWLPRLDDDELSYLAEIALFYKVEWNVPLTQTPLRWTWNAASNPSDPRYSGPSYDAFAGHLGHRHVSGNDHWDPSLNVTRILELAREKTNLQPGVVTPQPVEEDMLNQEDKDWLIDQIRDAKYGDVDGDGLKDTVGQIVNKAFAQGDWVERIVTESQRRQGLDKIELIARLAAIETALVASGNGQIVTQEMLNQAVIEAVDGVTLKFDKPDPV